MRFTIEDRNCLPCGCGPSVESGTIPCQGEAGCFSVPADTYGLPTGSSRDPKPPLPLQQPQQPLPSQTPPPPQPCPTPSHPDMHVQTIIIQRVTENKLSTLFIPGKGPMTRIFGVAKATRPNSEGFLG